jgi:hypothetical protein
LGVVILDTIPASATSIIIIVVNAIQGVFILRTVLVFGLLGGLRQVDTDSCLALP